MNWLLIFVLAAVVCLWLAALNVASKPSFNWAWTGVAILATVELFWRGIPIFLR